jgi:tetratricopeptide (TPR) repeat protein
MRCRAQEILILGAFAGAVVISPSSRACAQGRPLDRWVKSDLRPGVISAPNFPPVDTLGPYPTLFPYSAVYQGFPQPLGHQIIYTSRNSYAYRPVTNVRGMVTSAIEDLRAGRWAEALVELEPVRAEAAHDGFAALLESQAHFGAGQYRDAAESLRSALAVLSPDRWGQTVVDRSEYFGDSQRYMQRLYALANQVRKQPTDPDARFLLGWHLGFLGHQSGAVRELQAAIGLFSQRGESPRSIEPAQRLLAFFTERDARRPREF